METGHMFRTVVAILLISIQLSCGLGEKKFPLLMPNVYPDRDELYLCTPVKVLPNKSFYIVGFEPNANMSTVHHMLVFGCSKPGKMLNSWDCGEMAVSETSNRLPRANPCAEGSNVIYAWALGAKALELPHNVGFEVGQNTKIQYIVLQVHYSKKFPNGVRDSSGLNLIYTNEPRNMLAGVVLLGTGGTIPPHSITHMETVCEIREEKTIYPFAYRTHTHTLGKVVTGYSIRRDGNGTDHWSLLGKRDPMTPQMFYTIVDDAPIKKGHKLAARCTMDSKERDGYTNVGPTHADEMCNFYLMYYVERGSPLDMKYCISEGPPYYYWSKEEDLNNIPHKEASSLD